MLLLSTNCLFASFAVFFCVANNARYFQGCEEQNIQGCKCSPHAHTGGWRTLSRKSQPWCFSPSPQMVLGEVLILTKLNYNVYCVFSWTQFVYLD